jgi:hypothetical protein
MRAAGFTLQVPRPRHGNAEIESEQAASKKVQQSRCQSEG